MTLAKEEPRPPDDAVLASVLFAIDPAGLGGVVLRAGPGPARDRWMAMTRALLPPEAPMRRIPPYIEDDRLLGGLDLTASLAAGRPVAQRGVLAESHGGVVIVAMAERLEVGAAARLAMVLDDGEVVVERDGLAARLAARVGIVALDEGLTPEEVPPAALLERLAFHIDLSTVGGRETFTNPHDAASVVVARQQLSHLEPPDESITAALCAMAEMFGLWSARAPLMTLRAARAHAALWGRAKITAEDAAIASRLVLAPQALAYPADAQAQPPPGAPEAEADAAPPPEPGATDAAQNESETPSQTDTVIAAIQAALPDDLLSRLKEKVQVRSTAARGRGSGALAKSARRGRPMGSRSGAPRSGARLNLVETLRAAAPWQKLRAGLETSERIQVRQSDFRIRRFVQRNDSTTIFVVDASGSSAFQRLAEAKGAVELLLARAYVARARVALIAFRGVEAELLLPPTRSLTRAKNRLAELPGGGGTPLASAVDAALLLARAEKARDHTPLLVFLTDGQANIARDGAPGRAAAEIDALAAAREVGEAGIAAVFVDTSPRARPDGDRFARAMAAVYAPLPYVDAGAMFSLVGDLQSAAAR
jgi:magnesium chelatase subunit D